MCFSSSCSCTRNSCRLGTCSTVGFGGEGGEGRGKVDHQWTALMLWGVDPSQMMNLH